MSKIIVITGGLSGIGNYLSKKFSKNNKVYILARNKTKIQEMQKKICNNNIRIIECDLLNKKNIENAFKAISNECEYVDVLINNAAYDNMSSIENYDYDEFKKIIDTNLTAKMYCMKLAINLLNKSKYASIINISSRLSKKPMLNSSAYCCAASAINMLTKCAAIEFEAYKVRVNCVCPSLTNTPLAKKSYSKKEIASTINKSTSKRLCKMDDIYKCICFLISKNSDYINGENITIDSGILLK